MKRYSMIGLALISCQMVISKPSLSTFNYTAAGVTPLVTMPHKAPRKTPGKAPRNSTMTSYIVLGREAGGHDKGRYDAFAGSRDAHDPAHPLYVAARELSEEAILSITLHMPIAQVRTFINDLAHTHCILAVDDKKYSYRTVLYLTTFSETMVNNLLTTFIQARQKAHHWHEKEKDALALVTWSAFKKAIISSSRNSDIHVDALVIDAHGTSFEQISLRPSLCRIIRPHLEHKPYVAGEERNARFYTLT